MKRTFAICPRHEQELKRHFFVKDLPISVVHAEQAIGMDEAPVEALKKKPHASILVAMHLMGTRKADAVISAGNTGAVMGAAVFLLKTIPGVMRPAIGSSFPHESGSCFIIDVGSNVDCKPMQLLQFGMMGSILVSHIMDIHSPRVGLLNIGEEPGKGNESVQTAYQLLEKSGLNFIGNIEGRDIMRGRADVVVCDGFTGNVVLKFAESIGRMVDRGLIRHIRGNLRGSIGHYLIRPKFRKLLTLFDYQETGGAPLLGVNGNCIIAHGSSGPKAIRNAVRMGLEMVKARVSSRITEEIGKLKGISL